MSIYIISVLIILAFGIFTVLFFIFMLDSLIKAHDLPTNGRTLRYLIKVISEMKPESDTNTFYDLGCGHGIVTLAVKKRFPFLKVYGIDHNAIRIFFAKLRVIISGQKINFKKEDIFQTDLRDADMIYTYLWYDLMPLLEKKLQKELKKGAVIITNTSSFPGWQPVKKIITCQKTSKPADFETLFVYIKS